MRNLFEIGNGTIVDLDRIVGISEAKSIFGMPGNNGYSNSAGYYFGFDITLELHTIIHIFVTFDTQLNKKLVNEWRDALINKWKE